MGQVSFIASYHRLWPLIGLSKLRGCQSLQVIISSRDLAIAMGHQVRVCKQEKILIYPCQLGHLDCGCSEGIDR
jgi:hypothetical protein